MSSLSSNDPARSVRFPVMHVVVQQLLVVGAANGVVQSTGGGCGLGLVSCTRLAEAIGGTLALDPTYDNGCRFVLASRRMAVREIEAAPHDMAVQALPGSNGNGSGELTQLAGTRESRGSA